MIKSQGDLDGAVFVKPSTSGNNANTCVACAMNLPGVVAVRDTKRPEAGAHIIAPDVWTAFITDVKMGRFDIA